MLHLNTYDPPVRARRWLGTHRRGRPMPATKDDVQRLRSIHQTLVLTRVNANDPVMRRDIIEALARAITLLEENISSSPVFWLLGAINSAWTRRGPYRFIPVDNDLNQWALEQLYQQMQAIDEPKKSLPELPDDAH